LTNDPPLEELIHPTLEQQVERKKSRALDERAIRTIWSEGRTANGFLPVPIPPETLARIVELAELGPTSANQLPLRIVFVSSPEAKAQLIATLSPGNVEKTTSAPVTAILGADLRFFEHSPRLMPHLPSFGERFAAPEAAAVAEAFARTNATIQGAYFMLAARAVGLDAGPMAGFDSAATDKIFFPDGTIKSLWLVNLGYGDDSKLFPRNPRFTFDEIAKII
jgi:3-hydroxypropanoate dehydrogenase